MNTKEETKVKMLGQYEIRIEDSGSTIVAVKGMQCTVRIPIKNADVKSAIAELTVLLGF